MKLRSFLRTCVIGAFCLFVAACETPEVLYTKLPEREVNEMIAVLSKAGIAADRTNKLDEKEGVTYDLQIADKTKFASAVEVLNAQGYPRKIFRSFGDVFKGDGMVSTPLEQKARYLYALSEELSQTISSIDGVKDARVHLVLSEVDPISRQRMPASASVMIQHQAYMNTATLIPKVKKLLSTAVDGLAYENVNVILFSEGGKESSDEKAVVAPSQSSPAQGSLTPVAPKADETPSSPNEHTETASSIGSTVTLLGILVGAIVFMVAIVWYLKRRESTNNALMTYHD